MGQFFRIVASSVALLYSGASAAAISDAGIITGITSSMTSIDPYLPARSSHVLRPVPNDRDCKKRGFCHYFDSRGVHYTYVTGERFKGLAAIKIDVARWNARELPALELGALRSKQGVIAQTNRFTQRTLTCQGQLCSMRLNGDGGLTLRFSPQGQLQEIHLLRWKYV